MFINHKIFFREHWCFLILSEIGMDKYFGYKLLTYGIVGEWFLGSIIIIYIIYPILLLVINKNILLINIILFFYIL